MHFAALAFLLAALAAHPAAEVPDAKPRLAPPRHCFVAEVRTSNGAELSAVDALVVRFGSGWRVVGHIFIGPRHDYWIMRFGGAPDKVEAWFKKLGADRAAAHLGKSVPALPPGVAVAQCKPGGFVFPAQDIRR